MINNNSIVSVGFKSEDDITPVGKLMSFEYYAPTGNGYIEVVVEPFTGELDKSFAAKLTSKLGDLISLSLTGGPADESHMVFLAGVEFSTSNISGPHVFDRMVIKAKKP